MQSNSSNDSDDSGHSTWESWLDITPDKRVGGWPMMDSLLPTLIIVASYIFLANYLPKVLKGRKFPVYYAVLAYNLTLIFSNLYMASELFITTRHYSWKCQPMDYSSDEYPVRTVNVFWWFYISKIVELLDTFFFIAKGNYRQLSFLHIYHHSTMVFFWWIGARYVAGGNSVPAAMINSSVHVVMYTYYFLAAFGPRFKKYLWWKKYLTTMQLAQFTLIFTLAVVNVIDGCKWPKWMYGVFFGSVGSFFVLFSNFYIMNYGKKDKEAHPVMNGKKVD